MATQDRLEPTRDEIDRSTGLLLLEFGASWCGYCHALDPTLEAMLENRPDVQFVWVEDGPGRPLGRSFLVKLWPTLIFMRDGEVIQRSVRPSAAEVQQGLDLLAGKRERPA